MVFAERQSSSCRAAVIPSPDGAIVAQSVVAKNARCISVDKVLREDGSGWRVGFYCYVTIEMTPTADRNKRILLTVICCCLCRAAMTSLCLLNPCMNGGMCEGNCISYRCICPAGITGPSCEIAIPSLCLPNPCNNGGICKGSCLSYSCQCPPGTTGNDCEKAMTSLCLLNPCMNGGMCEGNCISYRCICPAGITGPSCEIVSVYLIHVTMEASVKAVACHTAASVHLVRLEMTVKKSSAASVFQIRVQMVVVVEATAHHTAVHAQLVRLELTAK
ncbi:hypothetical protein LSH36_326g05008 [Paralvinella palmiformis]|uniref:EGF-like domain-containing protein n=1 Tax=Paralvinella palmiformis TaxID=53620 RepID=A0AAD9N206_9ANNE|nr:hypothetical protein LSH36_326g05008 [Paralvinella palmiformis]